MAGKRHVAHNGACERLQLLGKLSQLLRRVEPDQHATALLARPQLVVEQRHDPCRNSLRAVRARPAAAQRSAQRHQLAETDTAEVSHRHLP